MKPWFLSLPLALSLLAAPAYALEYTSDGPPQDTFRDTTSAEGYTWTEPNIDRIKDAAHFQNTSIWGDNVCLAGHNRGTNEIFGKIHKLNVGDTITLTTKLGTDERQAKRDVLAGIFAKFGSKNLSGIKESDYPALMKELVAANG